MKKLFSLFAVVMMAVMSLNLSTLTVAAEEPTTYIVKYDVPTDKWYYQVDNEWDEQLPLREMYYMTLEMKDGDYVVVVAQEGNPTLDLDFHLGNLTITANSSCTANVKSIKDCYILSGAQANINCDVTNGYLYDFSVCNDGDRLRTGDSEQSIQREAGYFRSHAVRTVCGKRAETLSGRDFRNDRCSSEQKKRSFHYSAA